MRRKITIIRENEVLHFYLCSERGRAYLFTQEYSKGVYDYFLRGRFDCELFEYKKWNKNPRLDKTIEKIPVYMKYVLSEAM